jgi:hypothetical protein
MLATENMMKDLNKLSDEGLNTLLMALWIDRLSEEDKKHFEELVWKVKLNRGERKDCLVELAE